MRTTIASALAPDPTARDPAWMPLRPICALSSPPAPSSPGTPPLGVLAAEWRRATTETCVLFASYPVGSGRLRNPVVWRSEPDVRANALGHECCRVLAGSGRAVAAFGRRTRIERNRCGLLPRVGSC